MKSEMRRFIPIGDEKTMDKFNALCGRKNLSRDDVILILKAVKLNPEVNQ